MEFTVYTQKTKDIFISIPDQEVSLKMKEDLNNIADPLEKLCYLLANGIKFKNSSFPEPCR